MIKSLVRRIANGMGYDFVRRGQTAPAPPVSAPNAIEREVMECVSAVRSHTMLPYARLRSLYRQTLFCEERGIEGAFVECGTWKGGAVGLMALCNLRHAVNRRHLHLFDSFQGVPEPDECVDGERAVSQVRAVGGRTAGGLRAVKGFYEHYADGVGTLDDNRHLLETIIGYDKACLHYHVGWFQETVPKAGKEIGPIAVLRLDGDWYASTRVCLEHLYERVVNGGFVIFDDYGYYEGSRRAVDEFAAETKARPFLNEIDSAGAYWIKP